MSDSFICLLSGGLDSVVNLYLAHQAGDVLKAITFNYTQRSVSQEIKASQYFADALEIEHVVIDLTWMGPLTQTALVNRTENIPRLNNLDDLVEANVSAARVWVPNRNGTFLNVAASFAESLKADYIVPGFNKEEAATFPDNSQDFIEASNAAFKFSTMSHVKVKCFTTQMDKTQIVAKAKELGIDLKKVWSCYEGGEVPCENCESCQRTLRALDIIGI